MTLCASLAVTMHQHDHSRCWMQYSPQSHDSPSELQQKRQSLLLLRKAITAYINKGQRNDDTARPVVHQQGLGSQGNPAAPHFTSTVQQHQVPAAPQLLTLQEDFAQALHRIQQAKTQVQPSLQQLPSPQHAAQEQQLQQQTRQQPQPQQSSHPKDLLSRLLGPVNLPVSATVGGATALCSTVQDGIEQQQQQVQERPEHKQGINRRDLLSRLAGPSEPDAASAATAAINPTAQEAAGLAAQGLAEQQQQQQQVQELPQLQQGTNHRDFLSRLFGPADTRTGNKNAGILAQQDRLEQQQQDQGQQLWQSRKKQKLVGQQQHMQQPLQHIQLPQSLQQQWHPNQQGGRRRLLPQQQSKLAPQQQQQQRQREQQLEQPSKQQIQQQQRYDLWEQMGHHITHDAQSQAAVPGVPHVAAAAAATADTGAAITAWAQQLKPLLSPRTATHVPQSSRKAWQDSRAVAEQQQRHQGQQPLLQQHQLGRDQQQLPQHTVLSALDPQQPLELGEQSVQVGEQHPGLHQHQHQHEAPPVAAADADSTPTPCQVVSGTPLGGTLAPASGAAAAAAAGSSSAAAGDGSGPCLLFGSFVAESPAAAAAAAPPPPSQAAKAVAARHAATVSNVPIAAPAVAAAAAAEGDLAFVAESPATGIMGIAHGHTAAAMPDVAFVAESPAMGPPTAAAAAEAGDCVVQRLFTEEDRPSMLQHHQQQQQQQVQQQQQEEREQATTAATARRGDQHVRLSTAAADGLLPAQGAQQQQQQQVQAQEAGVQAAKPIRDAAAAAAGDPDQHGALMTSSSGSIVLSMQQPMLSMDVGLPVIHVATCQQQCLIVMQHQQQQTNAGSSRFELLLLEVHQQQRHHAVVITMGGLASMSNPGHAGAAAAAAAATSSLIANCVKLLPVCTSPGHSRTGGVRLAQHLPAAVIAAVDSMEISSAVVGDSTAAAAAAASSAPPVVAAAAAVTPTGAPAQNHTDHKTPNSSSVSTGKRSLTRSLTRSSSDRKPLLGRIAAANATAAAGIEPQQQHGVNIYRMTRHTEQLSNADPHQQQQQGKVELIQRLHTAAAVTCLAVCEQQRLLAAAGASGYACVWTLLPDRQQQQQQPDAVVDPDSAVVLPAAAYRGISFPDVSDLCFVLQPASSSSGGGGGNGATSSSSGGVRVLLVGSCSQGSVAVWDVQQQQQIISVHSPDINIHGLLPLQVPTVGGSSGSRGIVSSAKQQQGDLYQQQQQQPEHETLLLLALVAAKGSSCSSLTAAAFIPEGRLRTPPPLLLPQQQQVLELRPILLQQPGLLTAGTPVLRHTLTPDQQTHGRRVQYAAILGRIAAAATYDSNALVTVWDVVTGRVLITAGKPTTAAPARSLGGEDSLPVGLLLGADQQQQQDQQDHNCADTAVTHRHGVPVVAVIGSGSGSLTLALL